MNKSALAIILGVILLLFVAYVIGQGNVTRRTEIRKTVIITRNGQTTVSSTIEKDSWLLAPFHEDSSYSRDGYSQRVVVDQVLLREWYEPIIPFLATRLPDGKR